MNPAWMRLLIGLFVLGITLDVWGQDIQLLPNQSQWRAKSSPLNCSLSYQIPGYGKAIIEREAGDVQNFTLEVDVERLEKGSAKVYFKPPHWKYDQARRCIGVFKIKPGTRPIHFDRKSYDLMSGLQQGLTGYIVMTPANTPMAGCSDKVTLSPVGFQKSYREYLSCLHQLIPHDFSELKKTTLYFESGSSMLSVESDEQLKELARFIVSDGKIRQIKLFGHSDSKGGYQANRQLVFERMWSVKDYLVMKHGVSPNIFKLKDMVDHAPAGKNKTKEGRAKNRRVIVELYR